jgi:putative phosphoesterase
VKLLSFSDLHVDTNNAELKCDLIGELASYIRDVNPDRVVIAGDMAGGAKSCIRYLDELAERTGIPISYVPGNHSVWTVEEDEGASWKAYEALRDHPSSLIDRPVELGHDWVLLGDMGWYDYSFQEPGMTRADTVLQKKMVWRDSVFARFGMEDEEVCIMMLEKFERLLTRYRGKKVVFVNHFLPYDRFMKHFYTHQVFRVIIPFMGSARLGELLDRHEQVKVVIFGHIHWRHGLVEHNGKQVVCNPLGYVREWRSRDVAEEIRRASTILELG